MARLRPVAIVLHLQAVLDDGDILDPVQVEPIQVTVREWPPDLHAIVAELQARLESPTPELRLGVEDQTHHQEL